MTYDKGKKHNTSVATLIKIYVSKSFVYIGYAADAREEILARFDYLDWKVDGGIIKRLHNYNLKSAIIPVPSLEEQSRIISILTPSMPRLRTWGRN